MGENYETPTCQGCSASSVSCDRVGSYFMADLPCTSFHTIALLGKARAGSLKELTASLQKRLIFETVVQNLCPNLCFNEYSPRDTSTDTSLFELRFRTVVTYRLLYDCEKSSTESDSIQSQEIKLPKEWVEPKEWVMTVSLSIDDFTQTYNSL